MGTHMEVMTGGPQTLMAQQQLQAAQVHSRLQEVTGEGVAERFDILLHLIDKH